MDVGEVGARGKNMVKIYKLLMPITNPRTIAEELSKFIIDKGKQNQKCSVKTTKSIKTTEEKSNEKTATITHNP